MGGECTGPAAQAFQNSSHNGPTCEALDQTGWLGKNSIQASTTLQYNSYFALLTLGTRTV